MRPTTELPDDPALPGLLAIRTVGLGRVGPARELGGGPEASRLVGYTPGSRATLEVRSGRRRFALKAYAHDAEPEAALYQALAAAGFGEGGRAGARVPPLLAWEPSLQVLALGWLEGPPARQLIRHGQGRRAGAMAARWLWSAASAPVKLGPTVGVAQVLLRPPYPRFGRRARRARGARCDRLAAFRTGAGRARRRRVPGDPHATAAARRGGRRGVAGGRGVSDGDSRAG